MNKDLKLYKEEWNKLWDKYLESENKEQRLEDELRNIIQDVSEIKGCSTSKAFNVLMGWEE